MVKQWKQSLEQTDIVSDGEAFPGGHIDQPISEAGGGVEWAEKTPQFDGSSGSSDSEVAIVDVSGSGYIIGIVLGDDAFDYELIVDGDVVLNAPFVSNANISCLFRFENGFELKDTEETEAKPGGVAYVLD